MRSFVAALSLCLMAGIVPVMAETGIASTYNEPGCVAQQKPHNGGCERFNPSSFTAAHRTLPFGTIAHVVNRRNGLSVYVKINDRGPYVQGRIIDLTPVAASKIGSDGLAPVTVTVVAP